MNKRWTVITSFEKCILILSVFKSIVDACEYAAFVIDYDTEKYDNWTTYVVEGDFLNAK